ncbi:hypothetical protein KKF91_20675 [Myxococcota bacterium]|nr:hypothetical protein [Myxococcota bacterium]MBU1432961.1 hypothetical protein [Myxococcota bacterium]MBU1896315.1 hypothetical protein [Myxococcota bacterium]
MSHERDEALLGQMSDYLEGDLQEAQRAELEALLREDPAFASELEAAAESRALLAGLAPAPVPQHFLRKLQRRVRRRTGGRLLGHRAAQPSFRFSIEIFVVIAVVVMSACWLLLQSASQQALPKGPLVEDTRPLQP